MWELACLRWPPDRRPCYTEYISIPAVTATLGSAWRRVTFEKRESNQSALAPPLGTSPRLGVPEHSLESVGRRHAPSMARGG